MACSGSRGCPRRWQGALSRVYGERSPGGRDECLRPLLCSHRRSDRPGVTAAWAAAEQSPPEGVSLGRWTVTHGDRLAVPGAGRSGPVGHRASSGCAVTEGGSTAEGGRGHGERGTTWAGRGRRAARRGGAGRGRSGRAEQVPEVAGDVAEDRDPAVRLGAGRPDELDVRVEPSGGRPRRSRRPGGRSPPGRGSGRRPRRPGARRRRGPAAGRCRRPVGVPPPSAWAGRRWSATACPRPARSRAPR